MCRKHGESTSLEDGRKDKNSGVTVGTRTVSTVTDAPIDVTLA